MHRHCDVCAKACQACVEACTDMLAALRLPA
jgi:predicted nucleic acid-binding Zn ribbon protein